MTQTEFNNKVATLYSRFIEFTNIATEMEQSGDPYTQQSKDRQRFLANVLYALQGYDLTSELLTEDQILYTFELGICSTQSCST